MPTGFHLLRRVATILAVAWLAALAQAADVHVAPHGNDTADGSAERPVASLRRALDRGREIRAADGARGTPVEIAVADGRYEVAEPVVITPEDSGTETSPTVIRAEAGASPVFSGGRVIRGWEVASADGATRWTVHLLTSRPSARERLPKCHWPGYNSEALTWPSAMVRSNSSPTPSSSESGRN